MIALTYLAIIVLTLLCLFAIDWRFKLCIFANRQLAIKSLFVAWLGLLIWDILGIWQGIFFSGASKYETKFYIAPEIPIEEIFMLLVIVYTPLLLWTYHRRKNV